MTAQKYCLPIHLCASPGPLEVYLPDKGGYSEAGRKLVQVRPHMLSTDTHSFSLLWCCGQFLQARRVEPSCLVVGCMDQVHYITACTHTLRC